MKYAISGLLLLAALACTSSGQEESSAKEPVNIILLIGDGMGLSAVSTGFYYGDGPSNFNRFKHIGLVKTSSATHKITDSAAAGTAMSTGQKTKNGTIGMDTLKTPLKNITEIVSGYGWSTGVIATSSITHVTPASFYAHVEARDMEEEIAVQLLDSEIDFFAGGGTRFFTERSDGQDLFKSEAAKGFVIDTTALDKPDSCQVDRKYGFLLAEDGMPNMMFGRGYFTPDATKLALELLSQDQDGFFLMVEGSQIDWGGHSNSPEYVVTEMLDFEKVIGVVMDFAENDGNTLVVVTADHETGGFTLAAERDEATGYEDNRTLGPTFSTWGHSATLVPVFAYGPGAEQFMGIYENTELFHKMAGLAASE